MWNFETTPDGSRMFLLHILQVSTPRTVVSIRVNVVRDPFCFEKVFFSYMKMTDFEQSASQILWRQELQ